MNRLYLIFLLLILCHFGAFAQRSSIYCAHARLKNFPHACKPTVASPLEDNYDINYLKFNLNMNDSSTYVSGDVTTIAKVVSTKMSAYVFELNASLVIDSVLLDGTNMTATRSGIVCTVNLPVAIPVDTVFSVQVFYHGSTPSGTPDAVSGINSIDSVTFTDSEPFSADCWWPCKQSLQDKIDSVDMWITVPSSLKAGSNGTLEHVTSIAPGYSRYEWKERYPIDFYLISATVAPYKEYSYYIHFSGSTDSMLYQNYYLDSLEWYKTFFDSTALTVDYFSTLLGRYPFWHEKYGHSLAPFYGGEEHQTMTSILSFGITPNYYGLQVYAHELSHQWFGDNITCATWKDIWLNEGFATYMETVYLQHYYNKSIWRNDIAYKQYVALSDNGSVYVDDTTDPGRIFSENLTYCKGGDVLHMLRFLFNNDSLFFQTLKTYVQQYAGGTATTDDFKAVAEHVSGQKLDTFFNQWIYGRGYPVYGGTWNQSGNQVYLKVSQFTTVPSSVKLFSTPIEFQLHSDLGDTIVRVYNNQASQLYTFTWNKPMKNVIIDPNYWLLFKVANLFPRDTTLNVVQIEKQDVKVYPNPATQSWEVSPLNENTSLTLTDITGHTVWQSSATAGDHISIPAYRFSSGIYMLHIAGSTGTYNIKLIRQ